MPALSNIGILIDSDPRVHGGQPLIAGTGVTVRRIAIWHQQGFTPSEIAEQIGHLTLAQVYAALTYYHANQAEIDADIAVEVAEYDRLDALHNLSKQH
ncbi:DUF433 domain-containing protein [Myxacorys almedinensis]|uniref:DUF433 domain-containing protein n=1 Tax=Myxacorys almedinensis A TaxID=2690445 RepID=A0A8J7Z4D4_9CYAN|nr:DUF433 domain-containing protein [Myxacorys almedinensis]NDJ19105.1 DUF433 domain-containing protein [Myxacorys almedinensis A]